MKVLLAYSSKTGNTEKVARAIQEVAPAGTVFSRIEETPPIEEFDMVVIGFWIDRGKPNQEALDYLNTIRNKKAAFFCTMGAVPDSPHGEKYMEEARAILRDNQVVGEFACQGKIDEKLIESFKSLPADHPHAFTEESRRRYEAASSHPDEADLERAREAFRTIFQG